jgi:two-component system cell cycle sensor histidine kinase/response regulator CckA
VYDRAPDRGARLVRAPSDGPLGDSAIQGSTTPRGNHVRILLADDDPEVRAITTRILHRQSWEVVSVANGLEAVACWPADGAPFDLVILDVNMPEMNGYEAFRELQRIHPESRILFISGYAEVPSWRRLVEEGGQPFLAKPFSPRQLIEVVRTLIDNDEGAVA